MNRYVGKMCPYCRTAFTETDEVVVCSECEMPHHKDCWISNNGCTTFGCQGTIQGIDIPTPSYQVSTYQQAAYQTQTYQQPTYQTAPYQQQVYKAPSYQAPAYQVPANQQAAAPAFCGKCGAKLEPNAAFCGKCGARV